MVAEVAHQESQQRPHRHFLADPFRLRGRLASLLGPWDLLNAHELARHAPQINRKIAAFWATVPMFAYILIGLWLDRFFIWLGALVTVATVVGYYFIGEYFYLWMAVCGGGALIASGLFIRKNWN